MGTKIFQIHCKLKQLRHALTSWSKATSVSAQAAIKRLSADVKAAKEDPIFDKAKIKAIEQALNLEMANEELFWKQKARISWLREGDRNIKFFHTTTVQRRNYNSIKKLRNAVGEIVTSTSAIADEALHFYKNRFSSSQPSVADMDVALSSVDKKFQMRISNVDQQNYR